MKLRKIRDAEFKNLTLEKALKSTKQKWYNLSHCKPGDIDKYIQECGLCTFYTFHNDNTSECLLYKVQGWCCDTWKKPDTLWIKWRRALMRGKPKEAQEYALQLYELICTL